MFNENAKEALEQDLMLLDSGKKRVAYLRGFLEFVLEGSVYFRRIEECHATVKSSGSRKCHAACPRRDRG